ncbi:hypothetical protein [Aliiroseovarius sp. 2305UL8-7]|uniref:hypothetical protein n=1 Tax=Aliiroseovarius conchicola TaxID=3121637 RepID=UPI00352923BB
MNQIPTALLVPIALLLPLVAASLFLGINSYRFGDFGVFAIVLGLYSLVPLVVSAGAVWICRRLNTTEDGILSASKISNFLILSYGIVLSWMVAFGASDSRLMPNYWELGFKLIACVIVPFIVGRAIFIAAARGHSWFENRTLAEKGATK